MNIAPAVQYLKSRLGAARAALDVRVFFFLSGLASLWWGLYLFRPWVSFTVCGVILMLVGYVMEE